jgi:hypothetical protein
MDQRSKRTAGWLGFAILLILAAIWQSQVTAVAALQAGGTKPTTQQRIRHAPCPTADPVLDPVPGYVARSEKGLSDQEIRWIAQDFRNAGLDRSTDAIATGEEAFVVRSAQERWYLSSLVDALGLTPQQSTEAAAKLAEFTRQRKVCFFANIHDWGSYKTDLFVKGATVNLELMPWKLCDLDPEQEKITAKRYFDVRDLSIPIQTAPQGTPDFQIKYPSYPVNLMPGAVLLIGNDFEIANIFMPLLSSQKLNIQCLILHDSEPEWLDKIRKLHPAQLKIMMLLSPQIAEKLLNNLEADRQPQRIAPGP